MIGVVGSEPERFVEALSAPGASVWAGAAPSVVESDPEAVVALGESAMIDLVRAGVEAPVLPVCAGSGLESISREDALGSIEGLLSGPYDTRDHPVLDVRVGDDRAGRALFDVMLVTSEPGRISEYTVEAGGPVDRFRADGVVVATPAGSHGYASAAGGPLLAPGVDAVAVVPVAAFEIRPDVWVIDPEAGITLAVERDEGEISLLVDDRERPGVPNDCPVRVGVDGHLTVVRSVES